MNYLAMVVRNNSFDDNKVPYPGCITVVCPQLFGIQKGIPGDLTQKELWQYGIMSDWIYPKYNSSSDFFLPDIGDLVIINSLSESKSYVWEGVAYKMDTENYFLEGVEMEKTPDGAEIVPNEYKTRIIGDKNGSKIIFYDSWIKDKDSSDRTERFKIIVGGKNNLHTDRTGIEIEVDATTDGEVLTITVPKQDGSEPQKLTIDNGKGFIELRDKHDQYLKIDSEGEEIVVEDKSKNKIVMNSDGVSVETNSDIKVKAVNVDLDASGDILLGGSGATNGVFFEGTGLTLSGLLNAIITHDHIVPQSPTGVQTANVSIGLQPYNGGPDTWYSQTVKTKA